jgi:hypothetical protein
MNHYLQKGFYAKRVNCNFKYKQSFFQNEINEGDIQLYNLEKEIIYCKNDIDYIKCFIENIKEKVIKKCKNLNSVKIILAVFDKNNIFHKIMVVITTMIWNILKIKDKINLYKSIIVIIEYEGHPIFIGDLNFTGLD